MLRAKVSYAQAMAVDFEEACSSDPPLADAHRLIRQQNFDAARAAIAQLPAGPGRDVAELRLELEAASDTPELVMQRLVQLMRKHPQAPGARELYRRASDEAYGARSSSPSHSHPYLPAVNVPPIPSPSVVAKPQGAGDPEE